MQLFGRRARADSHGRFHLTCEEMAELYKGFHKALADTYWESASNHKICTDAMEAIRTTHISKKSGKFLRNFCALVREVYSHAHYNVQELLYEERDSIRNTYWETICGLLDIMLKRADHIWTSPCSEKMSILLQFSSLFSLYKDVANEEFIQRIYTLAVEYMQAPKHKKEKEKGEEDKMFDYFDQIQLVYRLRKEMGRNGPQSHRRSSPQRRHSVQIVTPVGPRMEHRESRLATKEELDDFFDKIMKEQQKQRRRKTPTTVEEEEDIEAPPLDMWVASSSNDENDQNITVHVTVTENNNHLSVHESKGSHSRSSSPSRRRGSFVHLPEILGVIKKLNPVSHHNHHKHDEPAPEMAEFDFKAEFEKRFAKRGSTGSASGVVVDLPVIAKPNPMDRVFSYRRQGLFNDTDVRKRGTSESRPAEEFVRQISQDEKLLVPPPKPPRAISPRTMERKIVEAVMNGSSME